MIPARFGDVAKKRTKYFLYSNEITKRLKLLAHDRVNIQTIEKNTYTYNHNVFNDIVVVNIGSKITRALSTCRDFKV